MSDAPETPSPLEVQVIRVIAQTQRLPVETITINSTFDELNIDSLDGINIIFALENEFGIEIPDEGLQNMRSLREMASGVGKLVSEKSHRASSGAA